MHPDVQIWRRTLHSECAYLKALNGVWIFVFGPDKTQASKEIKIHTNLMTTILKPRV